MYNCYNYYKVVKGKYLIFLNLFKNKILKMHILQPKHIKLKPAEIEKLLSTLNVSLIQLPKIKITDPALPDGCEISDIIKIEFIEDGNSIIRYRVVAV